MSLHFVQVNLQQHFGGGEVFTAFLCRALERLGMATTLVTHPESTYWDTLGLPASTTRRNIGSAGQWPALFDNRSTFILGHGPLPRELLAAAVPRRLLGAIAHMPVQGRDPRQFAGHEMVFPVSGWVREGLLAASLPAWDEPLYGVADLSGRPATGAIHRNSRYAWDRRKFRDRLLGVLEPLVSPLQPRPLFKRRHGLTLGIVSRLTPIKQFPQMFAILAPALARFPNVFLEIFGAGGYASVRDLDRALRPLGDRVRFWGHQQNVRAVYAELDYLLSGLPEKEALGLNIIEAQACDLPVLAVNAAPFNETVADKLTGYLYCDPRADSGAHFGRLLASLGESTERLHPAEAHDHLARFNFDAFVARIGRVLDWARLELDGSGR